MFLSARVFQMSIFKRSENVLFSESPFYAVLILPKKISSPNLLSSWGIWTPGEDISHPPVPLYGGGLIFRQNLILSTVCPKNFYTRNRVKAESPF
jgi:hypothetical protein